MNEKELLDKVKKELENAVENVVKDFSNKLGSLLLSIISEKIKITERFIDTEADLLEEFTSRNFAQMRSDELLDLMVRIEKLISNSVEYLNQVKDDIKLLRKEDIPVISTPTLSVLTPQQRELLRNKILHEISIIQEGKEDTNEEPEKEEKSSNGN